MYIVVKWILEYERGIKMLRYIVFFNKAFFLNFDWQLVCKIYVAKMALCYILTFDPVENAIPRWWTGRRWHILMAVIRGNRVGGNWLMKWDELKNSHGTLMDWCTGREWPLNWMTVISAWWQLNIRFQRSSGRRTIIWASWVASRVQASWR